MTAAGVLALLGAGAPTASAIEIRRDNDLNLGGFRVSYRADLDQTDVVNHVTATIDLGGAGTADDELDLNESTATIDIVDAQSDCKKINAHNASCPLAGVKELDF